MLPKLKQADFEVMTVGLRLIVKNLGKSKHALA